mgnify:CR=1 FL=1
MSEAQRKASLIALCALVLGAWFAGASTLFVRLSELGPIATAFQRVFLSVPALFVLVAWRPDSRPDGSGQPADAREFAILALAGAFFAGDLIFWHLAIMNTTVANATLLATMSPIYVTVGMFALFGERPSGRFLAGMALAIFGAALLISGTVAFSPERVFGDVCGIVTGFFFAGYMITVGRLRNRLTTAAVMFWSTVVTAFILLPVAWLWEGKLAAATLYGWAVLVALALVSHVGGQGLIAYALAHLPTAFSSLTMVLEVFAAAFLGWVFLSEPLGLWQWAGAAVIIAGLVVARRGEAKFQW